MHPAARLEIALKIVRNADGTESASEQLYQVVGAGTSTIESVPCAIALVELAQTDPNRSGETFWDLLEQAATQQAGETVSFR